MTAAELDNIAGVECIDFCTNVTCRQNKRTGWAERIMQFMHSVALRV